MLSAELNLVFGCGKQQVALQNLLKFKQAAGTYFRFGLVNLGCSTSAHKDDSTNSHELTWNKLAATYQV